MTINIPKWQVWLTQVGLTNEVDTYNPDSEKSTAEVKNDSLIFSARVQTICREDCSGCAGIDSCTMQNVR